MAARANTRGDGAGTHRGAFEDVGVPAEVVDNVPLAIERALAEAESSGGICLTGSLFVAAEAREHLGLGKKERI
jgi:hypothetical protein